MNVGCRLPSIPTRFRLRDDLCMLVRPRPGAEGGAGSTDANRPRTVFLPPPGAGSTARPAPGQAFRPPAAQHGSFAWKLVAEKVTEDSRVRSAESLAPPWGGRVLRAVTVSR